MNASAYAVPLLKQFDDDLITALRPDGIEQLHFTIEWGDKTLRCRYPRYAQWDGYCQSVYTILRKLSLDSADLEIPGIESGDALPPTVWAQLSADIVHSRQCAELIRTTFMAYLMPEVDGYEGDDPIGYVLETAPFTALVDMLVALLKPEDRIKKKTSSVLLRLWGRAALMRSTSPSSQSNGAGPKDGNGKKATSPFDSFS